MVGIYLIRNRVSGKCYVGQAMDIEKRWRQHIYDAKNPKFPIHKAIAKYGADKFDFSVIEECSADELDAREIHWIEELDTYNNGYNCTIGGDGRNQGKDSYSPEYNRAYYKAYYEAHKDDPEFKKKQMAAVKAWRDANPDKDFSAKKAWRESNPEKHRAAHKAWVSEHQDYMKNWRELNREKYNAYQKAYRESHKFTPTPDHTEMPLW